MNSQSYINKFIWFGCCCCFFCLALHTRSIFFSSHLLIICWKVPFIEGRVGKLVGSPSHQSVGKQATLQNQIPICNSNSPYVHIALLILMILWKPIINTATLSFRIQFRSGCLQWLWMKNEWTYQFVFLILRSVTVVSSRNYPHIDDKSKKWWNNANNENSGRKTIWMTIRSIIQIVLLYLYWIAWKKTRQLLFIISAIPGLLLWEKFLSSKLYEIRSFFPPKQLINGYLLCDFFISFKSN